MRALRILVATAACAVPLSAQAAELVRTDDGWVRLVGGETFAVHPDVVTVRFVEGIDDVATFRAALDPDDLLARLGVERWNRLGFVDLRLPEDADPVDVVARLRASGLVASAEVNMIGRYVGVPNDPQFGTQWNLQNTGQSGGTPGADVKASDAWEISGGDPSITVAVLDSGTEWTHDDLAANIWTNPGEVLDGIDNDANGFVDDIRGWDFEANDNDPDSAGFYHGTAVAGVVAAVGDNGIGIAGLAGGGDAGGGCTVMPCNVGSFFPDTAVLDDAILYAADNGARVITMSLTVTQSAAVDAAVASAYADGVFIDCAAGNGFGSPVTYPASLDDIAAVGSTDDDDLKSSFSNAGNDLEISAPGDDILMLDLNDGYTTQDGTSFSAPHVAALAGLILSVDPALTPDAVRTIITSSAEDIGAPGFDTQTGWGRIDAAAALALAAGGTIGTVEEYGAGLAGVQGLPLIFDFGGLPQIGNADFGVELRRGAPDAPAWLIVGLTGQVDLPFKGGSLLASPSPPGLVLPLTTSGVGTAQVPLPLPDDDQLPGLMMQLQFVVDDAAAIAGFALTGGLEVTLGG